EGSPNPEVAVGDEGQRLAQAPISQGAKDVSPGVLRLPVPDLHRQELLGPVWSRPQQGEQAAVLFLQPSPQVDAVRPDVDEASVIESTLAPGLVLLPPSLLESEDRVGRQRCRFSEQLSEDRLEVTA